MTKKEISENNKKVKSMSKRNAKRLEYMDRFNSFFGFYQGGKNDKSK